MQRVTLFFVFFLILAAGIVASFPKFCEDILGHSIITPDAKHVPTKQFLSLGTGGITGIYYPTGGAICRLINRGKQEHHLQCSVESTGGSVYNLNAISRNELDIGIAQSDLIHNAYYGTKKIKSVTPNKELRSIVSLYTEPLTIVARQDAQIRNFNDLKGKRVNIGAPGSGQRATLLALIDALGWSLNDFSQVSGLNPIEQATALCDNKLDAIIYSVGHPNGSIQEATSTCEANLVDITGPEIDKFLEQNPYYVPATIEADLYKGTAKEIKTFGVKVGLVTSSAVDESIVYEITKSIYQNFDSFKRLHPIFNALTIEKLFKEGIVAPLHPGAQKFANEKLLLNP